MTENLSFIIILEFVAPFAILSIILLMALLNSNKKSKKGLSKLLKAVQGGEEAYKQKLQEFLKNSGTSEDQMDELVQKFCKSRRAFFKRTLSAISHSDVELLTGLGGQFTEFSDLYHQLTISAVASSSEEDDIEVNDDAGDESKDELEATYKVVKRENKRLKAEVHVSVSALNSLFGEYASMFGETDKNKSDMSVQEVLDAMEKFTKGDFKPDNITGDIPPDDVAAAETEKEQKKTPVDDEIEPAEEPVKDSGESVESVESGEDPLEVKLEDIVVEDDSTANPDEIDEKSNQTDAKSDKSEEEPNWDEAFEETGDTPDEAAMDQVKQEEKTVESQSVDKDVPAQQETEEVEPSWDEAFEEAGDTADESATEQVKQSEQEEQRKAPPESKPDAPSEPEKSPKPE